MRTLLVLALLSGCAREASPPARHPLILVGVDGGEWSAIRKLWSAGRLPNLKRLEERGVSGPLGTKYGFSPIIWTTVATGVVPEEHGVRGFIEPTPNGDVPVSSTTRKVPALWNMATRAGLRVAVLSWWASWPAESVNGVIVSDRAMLDLDGRVSPPGFLPTFRALEREALGRAGGFASIEPFPQHDAVQAQTRDHVTAHVACELARKRFDLMLVYIRSVDVVSHFFWKYFVPEEFGAVDAHALEKHRDKVAAAYAAVDDTVGCLLAAAPAETNFLLVSDHGFQALRHQPKRVVLDFDRVLEHLRFLVRVEGRIDRSATELYTYDTHPGVAAKKVRCPDVDGDGGAGPAWERCLAAKARLQTALAGFTYANGAPVFRMREASPAERRRGAHFVAVVATNNATEDLLDRGTLLPGWVEVLLPLTGDHYPHTNGVIFAAGPDIDPAADLAGIDIHDVAPTVLYALGLPVAENFAGRAWEALFTAQFRRDHPLRRVASWGAARGGAATSSAADGDIIRGLRALGYVE